MNEDTYIQQAMDNLRTMSRTASGVVDTSASATKKEVMAVSSGDSAKDLAIKNFESALKMAWDNRYRVFDNPDDLRTWIEDIAREVNRGIVRDGVLYRVGADSAKYNYIPIADIENSGAWFFEHLFDLLCRAPYDAVEAAATAEYYINFTIHLFADGCGKSAMAIAAWLLMRGGHALPVYPGREAYYDFCKGFSCSPTGSEEDRSNFAAFLSCYRSLFEECGSERLQDSYEELTVVLPEQIYTANVGSAEAQINAILQTVRTDRLILDAAKLQYISSAGLRMLLRLKKDYEDLIISNVSESVYEILDVSGFTSLIRIDRRMKEISIEGCVLIGRGQNGSVYRYSADTIVKVYSDRNGLEDVLRENQMARYCFVSGLPTAIPLNLVLVDGRLGALYELLDAKSLARAIFTEPDRRDELIGQYIALMKRLHSIVPQPHDLPKGIRLPNQKKVFLNWACELEDVLDAETIRALRGIIEREIPESSTLLHGDLHPGNIMDERGELILIDMDGLSIGDPIFDLANISAVLVGFPCLFHYNILGWDDPALLVWAFEKVLDGYYADLTAEERAKKKNLIMLCMHTRLCRYAIRHDSVPETERKEELKKLYELVHSYR